MKKKFFILTILFFVLTFQSVNAQELTPPLTPSPTPVAYTLPYPGILPDHPFYRLKSFRDAIMDFLISNPLKKAEYELLQADKGLQATLSLIANKKDDKLVVTTLVDAENHFEKAIGKAQEAKKQGMETKELFAKLTLANKKHQEVIAELVKSTDGTVKEAAVKQLERIEQFEKTVFSQGS